MKTAGDVKKAVKQSISLHDLAKGCFRFIKTPDCDLNFALLRVLFNKVSNLL